MLWEIIKARILRFWEWIVRIGRLAFVTKSSVFYVAGRYLRDNDRENVILRGINLPLLDDWEFPVSHKLAQVEKSGANAVRIQWYAQYPNAQRPAYTVSDLDAFLEQCRTSRIIPIVMLQDCTCGSDVNLVNTQLMAWWTHPDVVTVLKKHERYLIINLANELGEYRWQGSTPAALDDFKNAYKQAITSIRSTGLRMPIMIDAPDCGTSIEVFISIGQELIQHDPRHSLLLSAHAYWADYQGMPHITTGSNAGLPIVFGEIANKQFNNGDECYYGLDGTNLNNPPPTGFRYQDLLTRLASLDIGWLAWAWYKDNCSARQITSDGTYTPAGSPTGLTPYGTDILENAVYGLRLGSAKAKRTNSLP